MRTALSVIIFVFGIFFFSHPIYACTCMVDPLPKQFRTAKAIFIGKLANNQKEPASSVQNHTEGLPILEVVKPFKGVKREFIAIDFDFDGAFDGGTCPVFFKFEEDAEYLIFAYGSGLKVRAECSDTKKLDGMYNYTTKQIASLSSFWFRSRARLWPF